MARLRISLANKCQLLFGLAVVLILTAALAVPWLRMQKLVDQAQRQIARGVADEWLITLVEQWGGLPDRPQRVLSPGERSPRRLWFIPEDRLADSADRSTPLGAAFDALRAPAAPGIFQSIRDPDRGRLYRFIYPVRESDVGRLAGSFTAELPVVGLADPLQGVVVVTTDADWADRQLLFNRIYIVIAGLLAGLLAIVVFWLITTRIILSPVRVLRSTAEKVSDGDLNIRADINTGDEFEQLSEAFNTMLSGLRHNQTELADLNKQLDLRLGELAESNLSLFEANKLKSDFLANVSHELRTPLHSIIGFAEVLAESIDADDAAGEKRLRYVKNIERSSRSLLEMINELLDLAKIEAGRIELHVEPMSVADACEGLATLIRPQAEAKRLNLRTRVPRDLPVVRTDPGKFQQIVFNFLSNAVKFTPDRGTVILGAAEEFDSSDQLVGVRVWVADDGPGIAVEHHEEVFEKFRQIDQAHVKAHAGTGLGLAISKELSQYLGGRIELDSDLGKGARFSLVVPLVLEEKTEKLMPDLVD